MPSINKGRKAEVRHPSGGGAQHQPHPNGGEVRKTPDAQAKMPEKQRVRPVTHTKLEIPGSKMPKTLGGQRQRDPHRR
jgi:hypothetical protein